MAMLGGVYSPYTGEWFDSRAKTDIEHIVARSEAHDSGLCSASVAARREFAADPLNLMLADPGTNRDRKSDKDAADWLPDLNRCWFANRVLKVKLKYRLSVDRDEAEALEAVLAGCMNFALVVHPPDAGRLSGIYVSASVHEPDGYQFFKRSAFIALCGSLCAVSFKQRIKRGHVTFSLSPNDLDLAAFGDIQIAGQ